MTLSEKLASRKFKMITKTIIFSIMISLTAGVVQSAPAHAAAKSVCFDGTGNTYLSRPSGMTNLPTTGAYTIEAWIQLSGYNIKSGIAGWGTLAGSQSNSFAVTNGDLYNWWYGSDNRAPAGNTLALNRWYHVAAQWDGTTRTLYKDGVLVASTASSSLNATNTSSFRVGGYAGEWFKGCMNNLRIVRDQIVYTGTFTPPTEMAVSQAGDGLTINAIPSANTVLLLDSPTDYTRDSSSYGNHLTANGGVTTGGSAPLPSQTITFGTFGSANINSEPITLGTTPGFQVATSNRNLTVSYSATAGSATYCTVSTTGVITVKAVGTCVVQASNSGNSSYAAATTVTKNLVITAAVPDAPSITSVSAGPASATLSFKPNRNGGATITGETITVRDVTADSSTTINLTSGSSFVSGTFPGTTTGMTYRITGLTNGHTYTFTVSATNSSGTSAASTTSLEVTPATAPNAVTDLRAVAGNTNVQLVWTPPSSLGGGSFTSYTIFKKLHTDPAFSVVPTETITASVNETNTVISGLTNGTAYDFKVVVNASGGTGTASDYSAFANLIPAAAPSAPRISIGYDSDTSAVVTWLPGNSNGSPITGFTIAVAKNGTSESCTGGDTSAAAGSSCTVAGVGGDIFTASAIATNMIGNSTTVNATQYRLVGVIDTPTAVAGTAGDGSISISYSLNTNGDYLDFMQYSIDSGTTWIDIASTSSPFVITGLTNGTAYDIEIRAVGQLKGVGGSAAAITVTPVAPPTAPPAAPPAPPAPVVMPIIPVKEEKKEPVKIVITQKTTSTESPVVEQALNAIKDRKTSENLFVAATTPPATTQDKSIAIENVRIVDSATAVNNKILTTTSSITASVTIALKEPVISDQITDALRQKVTVVTTPTGFTVTPVAGFTGVVVLPIIATIDGVQTVVYNKVVVSPEAPAPQGFAPVSIGQSAIAWTPAPSQVVSYQVAVNNKVVCTTATASCSVPALIGPNSKVTIVANGNDDTVSTPQVIPYAAKAPIPALKVNFATGSSVMSAAQKAEIAAIAKVIKTEGFTRLIVNGFTDSRGSVALNAALSKARANAVVVYMQKLLPMVSVKAGAKGSSNPIAPNTDPDGQAQNRRTEIATW